MAQDHRVELVDPNGVKFKASSPVEFNSLVFGAGYKLADDNLTIDKALERLGKGPVAEELATAQAVPAVEAAPKK